MSVKKKTVKKKNTAKRKTAVKKKRTKKRVAKIPTSVEEIDREDKEDVIYDEVTGAKGRKSALSLLNKRIVGSFEMDELFCDWE